MSDLASHHDQRRARALPNTISRLRAISLTRANGQAGAALGALLLVGLWQLVLSPGRSVRLLHGGSWWD